MATPLGVEFFTAVAGPLRLLDPKAKPVDASEVEKAADVAATIRKKLHAFLVAKQLPQGDEPPERDYFAVLEMLSSVEKLSTAERRSSLTAGLPDPSLALQYLALCDKVVAFLHEALPRERWSTLTGDKDVEPSLLEQSRFWRAWEVAENPLVVLRDLREGILVDDQVEVVKRLWPLTYAEITKTLLEEMAEQASKNEKWEVPFDKERQCETLLQISRLDPDLMAQLQSRARASEAQDKESRGGGVKTAPIDAGGADRLQTPTQRVANR